MNSLKRLATAVLMAAATLSFSAPALAQSGSWTDVSYLLNERQNRPVWAMAYAAPYWYLTDGQELWSGGHVWKTEGSTMTDITYEVRNAGLSRVDDIVSDGQTVMYLQYVALHDNSIQVLSYDGSYSNLTSNFRNQLRSDEGLSQVIGRTGTWYVMTTQGRLFRMTSNGSFTRVYLPNDYETKVNSSAYYGRMNYQVGSGSMSSKNALNMLPIAGGKWILVARNLNTSSSYSSAAYIYDGYNFTKDEDLTWEANYAMAIATNGNDILTVGCPLYPSEYISGSTCGAHIYRNSQKPETSVSLNGSLVADREVRAAWDGKGWLLLSGKHVASFDGSAAQNLDDTRDLFLAMAGNGNGVMLLGGAVSDVGSGNNPSSPLTAKLVRRDANGTSGSTSNGSFGGGRTYTSSNGPSITTSGNPSDFRVGNGGTFNYRATATDPNGIDRIDMYVNGVRIKTCNADSCEYDNVYYTNGLSTRAVPLYVRATDKLGYTTETSQETLTVDNSSATAGNSNNTNGNTQTSNGISYWTWLDPNQTNLRRDQTMSYNVGAWDADGLKRIEIYVNGNVRRTCDLGRAYGNQTCAYTLYGYDYTLNTNAAVNAKITDYTDKVAWTSLQNIYITDVNGSNNNNAPGDMSVWNWFDPSGTSLNRNSSATLKVQANATQGLNKVEVYADGNLKRTCYFSRVYGTQNCDLSVYGNDYSVAQHSFNAKATDYYGNTTWSDTRYLTIQDNGSNSNGNISVSNWFDSSISSLNRNSNANLNVSAYANNGLSKIEVYADGNLKRTCNYYQSYGTQECDLTVYGYDYSTGSHTFNAKATDYYGNTAWSSSLSLYVSDNGSNYDNNTNGSVGLQANPNQTSFNNGQSVTFYGSASDPDGLARIEILQDGSTAKTCYYSNVTDWQSCGYATTVYGNSYNSRTFTIAVKAYDRYGNQRGVGPYTYTVYGTSYNDNTNYNNGNQNSTWIWSEPETSTVANGQSVNFHVGAWSQAGIRKIEILGNGAVVRTCDLNGTQYGNQECSVAVATSYQGTTYANYYARVTDGNWNTFSSQTKSYTITNTNNPNPSTNTPGQLSVWSDRDGGYRTNEAITFTASGSDADGIQRIEILVNSIVVKTCYNSNSCSWTGGPYSQSNLAYAARLVDANGKSTVTGYKTIYRK